MQIIRDYSHCPDVFQGAVVALGNFDGVHVGHRAILDRCVQEAKKAGVKPAVMTFSPHPREFFGKGTTGLRLQSFRQKMALFAASGIEVVFVVRFNARFAAFSPKAFVEEVLARDVRAQHVVTGYNFAFGKGRGGDTAFLAQAAEACGMRFTPCSPVMGAGGAEVSSSAIRQLLLQGKMTEVGVLLGRNYGIEGRVIHGDKRGGAMGYPTANIALGKLFRPRYGVYAVRLSVEGQAGVFDGVANLGIRPMFALEEPLLEVHVFDKKMSLYGKRVCVDLVDFIREERSFDTLDGLKNQIAKDGEAARDLLKEKI